MWKKLKLKKKLIRMNFAGDLNHEIVKFVSCEI